MTDWLRSPRPVSPQSHSIGLADSGEVSNRMSCYLAGVQDRLRERRFSGQRRRRGLKKPSVLPLLPKPEREQNATAGASLWPWPHRCWDCCLLVGVAGSGSSGIAPSVPQD